MPSQTSAIAYSLYVTTTAEKESSQPRSISVRRLEGFEDAKDTIFHEIDEDDVAYLQQ